MNSDRYTVLTVQSFDRQAKRLVKKYPSLKTELVALTEKLSTDPKLGLSGPLEDLQSNGMPKSGVWIKAYPSFFS